jgi:hypothetical protein
VPTRLPVVGRHAFILNLRGGADMEEDDNDSDDFDDDLDEHVDEDGVDGALNNPFLDKEGGLPSGAGGVGGLSDLSSTLNDPKMLQEALKELQDPAVQQQVKAMMEDPAFQESMKQYMEQVTKDPRFEELKKQTETLMQQEGFMEQMSKAFSDMSGTLGALSSDDEDEK